MGKIGVEKFLELSTRSKLVDANQLQEVIDKYKSAHGGNLPSDAESMADVLVDAKLITDWHKSKLLDKKYKGFQLGNYKLLKHIGKGGMSTIYLAEHEVMRQQRALKVLPRSRVNDSSYLERFRLEAKATASLDHPNVVRAFDFGHERDIHFLVMEYVDGDDLQAIVERDGYLAFVRAADYIAQASEGLQYAHDQQLIHRDLKPSNVLVDKEGVVKLLDLGLAKYSEESDDASLTIAYNENVLGTADYLAPEQARNSHQADVRSDIYGLGCTFYFLLTGRPPFADGSIAQRIAKHQVEMPEEILDQRPDCPVVLRDLCWKMMHKNADQRPQTALEVAEALEIWLESEEALARADTPVLQANASGGVAIKSDSTGSRRARGGTSRGSRDRRGSGSQRRKNKDKPKPTRTGDTTSEHSSETIKGVVDDIEPIGARQVTAPATAHKSIDNVSLSDDEPAVSTKPQRDRPPSGIQPPAPTRQSQLVPWWSAMAIGVLTAVFTVVLLLLLLFIFGIIQFT